MRVLTVHCMDLLTTEHSISSGFGNRFAFIVSWPEGEGGGGPTQVCGVGVFP